MNPVMAFIDKLIAQTFDQKVKSRKYRVTKDELDIDRVTSQRLAAWQHLGEVCGVTIDAELGREYIYIEVDLDKVILTPSQAEKYVEMFVNVDTRPGRTTMM